MNTMEKIDSRKNLNKYREVCEEIRVSMIVENLCTPEEKKNFIFRDCYDVFKYQPNYNELMTSSSSKDLNFKNHFEVPCFGNSFLAKRNSLIRCPKIMEGIKNIINILTEKDAVLKKFDINDFTIHDEQVVLVRFHNIMVFPQIQFKEAKEMSSRSTCLCSKTSLDTRIAVKIMRCNNCHKRMELDLSSIIENPLTKDYTYYICPHCGEKKSLVELIRIYEENKKNSYYWFYKSPWGEEYIAQLF